MLTFVFIFIISNAESEGAIFIGNHETEHVVHTTSTKKGPKPKRRRNPLKKRAKTATLLIKFSFSEKAKKIHAILLMVLTFTK